MTDITSRNRGGLASLKGSRTGLSVLRKSAQLEQFRDKGFAEALVLCLDVSASMEDPASKGPRSVSKIRAMRDAAKALLAKSTASQVGIVWFSDDAGMAARIGDTRSAIAVLKTLETRGATFMANGLRLSFNMLVGYRGCVCRIIVMSDGFQFDDPAEILALAESNPGVIIDTVGFGDEADEGFLRSLAKVGKGIYAKADSHLQLVRVFKQLEAKNRGLLMSGGQK